MFHAPPSRHRERNDFEGDARHRPGDPAAAALRHRACRLRRPDATAAASAPRRLSSAVTGWRCGVSAGCSSRWSSSRRSPSRLGGTDLSIVLPLGFAGLGLFARHRPPRRRRRAPHLYCRDGRQPRRLAAPRRFDLLRLLSDPADRHLRHLCVPPSPSLRQFRRHAAPLPGHDGDCRRGGRVSVCRSVCPAARCRLSAGIRAGTVF